MRFSFADEAPQLILAKAPLVQAMCQVRFAPVPELVDDDNERRLAAALEDDYPIRGTVQGAQLALFGGQANPPFETFRTFEDVDNTWKVTLSQDAMTLETRAYQDRDDLIDRAAKVLAVLSKVKQPPKVTRIGVRYTDQVLKPESLRTLVRPSLIGMLADTEDDALVEHQSTQVGLRDSNNSQVLVRSLMLPPNAQFDPNIVAVSDPSWVLDIDASNQDAMPYEVDRIIQVARLLAKRAYQVFYWAVTDEFRAQFREDKGDQA